MPAAQLQPAAVVARVLVMSERRFYELLKRGVLPRSPVRGKYDLFACIRAYIEHMREQAAGRSSKDGDLDIVAERARLAREQADAMALKNAVTRGELVPAADIERAKVAIHSIVVPKILAVPRACARKVAREHEARACEAIIRAELHQALREISATELEVTYPAEARASGD